MSPERGRSFSPTWIVTTDSGTAADLHSRAATRVAAVGSGGRQVVRMDATRRAVVLGSAQPDGIVDRGAAAAAGLDVARRRSGGGAVLVGVGEALWVDVVLPAGDPLGHDDIGRAAWWVGAWWAAALRTFLAGEIEVWQAAVVRTEWSGLICFAGLGPGEVLFGGRKAVGVSQRRTRQGVLFQCAALLRWDPADLLAVLYPAGTPDDRARTAEELATVATGIGAGDGDRLWAALVAGLESVGSSGP